MKRVFMTLFTGAVALSLTSCNNPEEAKKLQAEDDAKVQTLVDEKFKALEDESNAACATLVDSKATELYTAWAAEQAKKGKKVAALPKPKPTPTPVPPKEEPKKEEPKRGFGGKVGDETPKEGSKGFGGKVNETTDTSTAPKKRGFGGAVTPK
jgi:hypothetical protein